MSTTETQQQDAATLYRLRNKRFNDILDGYECGAGNFKIPPPPATPDGGGLTGTFPLMRLATDLPENELCKLDRRVIIFEKNGNGYFVENIPDEADLNEAAAADISNGWWPVCYYDLDQLAGEEPPIQEGDKVAYEGEYWYVIDTDDDGNGLRLWLGGEENLPRSDADHRVWVDDVSLLERAEPDERMPVRYKLARIQTFVAFNSTPEAP